jgi:hypothetical protein
MAESGRKDKQPTGARPEWKAKQTRKKIGGVLKAVVGVAVLGVLVGLGIVFKDQIMGLFAKKEEPKVVVVPPPQVIAPPPPVQKIEPPPPVKVAPPPIAVKPPEVKPPDAVPSGEEEVAKNLITQGKALLEQFDFEKAQATFKDAGAKKCGAQLRSECKVWESKAVQFGLATKHIDMSEFAKADTSYILKMADGSEWQGLKIKEDDDTFTLQAINRANPAGNGRQRIPIARAEIKQVVPVSLKQRQQEFLELLGALESTANIQRSTDYYDLVYLSKRLMMGRECVAYLNRAYDGGPNHPADTDIGNSFRKEVVRRAIDRASLMISSGRPKQYVDKELAALIKLLPDFQIASDEVEAFKLFAAQHIKNDFKSTLKEVKKEVAVAAPSKPTAGGSKPETSARSLVAEDTIEVVVENGGVQGRNAASASIVDRANGKYADAMKLFHNFRQGTNGNNNKILKDSLVAFEECINLYEQALAKDPGNKDIENRMQEASMNCYSCRKYQTL